MRSDVIDITVQRLHETEKAVLVTDSVPENGVWLAKSMIEIEPSEVGGTCYVHTEGTEGARKYGTEYIRADVARADAELAVAEAIRRAAEEAASEGWPDGKRIGVSERDEAAMDCANRIETAILALAPAEALAEV